MKFLLSTFIVLFSFIASAETLTEVSFLNNQKVEAILSFDKRKKKARKQRRINKKRKKKCKQFGRRSYAG